MEGRSSANFSECSGRFGLDEITIADLVPAIRPGISLLHTSATKLIQDADRFTVCVLQVANYTKWRLQAAGVILKYGKLFTAQRDVEPGTVEAMVACKTAHIAAGTSGTASWKIEGQHSPGNLNVMWSIPYEYSRFRNQLGIRLREGHDNTDFDYLYKNLGEGVHHASGTYHDTLPALKLVSRDLTITASMGSNNKTEAMIVVKPNMSENLSQGHKCSVSKN